MHHLSGDALADLKRSAPSNLPRDAGRGFQAELAAVTVERRDGATDRSVALLEDLEDAGEGGAQVMTSDLRTCNIVRHPDPACRWSPKML
jgi:hypothetical protein